jgi:hypothetical protein
MMPIFRAARKTGGRHATRLAPAAPQDAPAAPAPASPSGRGGGARMTASLPAALIEATDVHAHLLAGVLLNAGEGFRDVAVSAPEDAAEAYVRWLEGEVERLKGQPPCTEWPGPDERLIVGSEPKTGKAKLTAERQREQIAAYRHATDPDAGGQSCPVCGHLWTLHGPDGCGAKVYPAHSLDGEPCPCEDAAPATEERM